MVCWVCFYLCAYFIIIFLEKEKWLTSSSFQSYLLFFHYETRTFRDTDTHSITKNDDDDADDDARDDDDAVFVFVFWKKQQKEPFDDDDHDGEEQR